MPLRAYARVRQFTPEESQQLQRVARSRTLCAGRVKRAHIILRSNQGYKITEIVEQLGVSYHTAERWIQHFNTLGIPVLEEGPRPGRPRVYSSQDVGLVIQTALTPPDQLQLPFGAWTLDRLVTYLTEVKDIPIKRSRISQIFLHEGLKWRQQEGWLGQRVDPDFAADLGAIETLYTHPPVDSVVMCIDELGPMTAVAHRGPQLVRPHPGAGQPTERAKQEMKYQPRTLQGYVFGALQPTTGETLTMTCERRTIANFVGFLEQVEAWVPQEVSRIYVVLDNLGIHSAYDVLLFNLTRPRWEFVFQPKRAPYLNLIEPWWKTLKSLALKGRRFETWPEVETAVQRATAYWNDHNHPYVWGRRRRHRLPRRFGVASTPEIAVL